MSQAMHPVRERTWRERQVKGFRRFWKTLGRKVPERIWLSWVVLRMIWSRGYGQASRIVLDVATDTKLYQEEIANPREGLKRLITRYAEVNPGEQAVLLRTVIARYAGFFPGAGEDLLRATEARARYLGDLGKPSTTVNALLELAWMARSARG